LIIPYDMASVSNITFYVAPPTTTEIGLAYVRLALGVSQWVPGLLNIYLGPAEWQEAVLTDSPSLEVLRDHAVATATAAQKSDLPRNRQERILRNVRALLWLIRAQENEQIMFSEQVRMLLDLQPESVGETFFQTAHDTLSALLPGSGSLTERWTTWQVTYTISATAGLPLIAEVLDTLRGRFGPDNPLTTGSIKLTETDDDGPLSYQQGELRLPRVANLRVDRLYHLAARWGYGGVHSVHTAMARRYAAGEGDVECAILLNLGPDQVITQGLPLALLPELDLYATAIPALLHTAGLPAMESEQLRAIHMAEDALQWGLANAALLLHSEGLRPRAVRRRLMTDALLPRETADRQLQDLLDPVYAAHVFAPLIGGPLLKAWLARENHLVATLLVDPPVPSAMVFEVRFAD
jgi:hypothetical protein